MCRRGQIALVVEPAGQLALRDRMIAAVQHVLLARPDQLDRRARHLLGDQHRLAHVVAAAAPAEAAAEHDLVDSHLAAGRPAASRAAAQAPPRRSASGSRPRTSRRVERGRVHRLHRRVVLDTDRSRSASTFFAAPASAALTSPCLVADEGLLGGRDLPSAWRRWCRWRPWRSRPRPRRSAARRARSWRATRCRRRRRPPSSPTWTTFLTPGMPSTLAASKLFTLPPKTGQSLIAAFSMPGSLTSMP